MGLNKENQSNYEIIKRSVLKKNKLSPKERFEVMENIKSTIKTIRDDLKALGMNAEVVLGGSSAKGSMIKGSFDADVFVRFNKKYSKDNDKLSDMLEKALTEFKNKKRVHGSRDYFQFELNKINYEIIPVLNINNPKDVLNVTDMSPLHVNWIKGRINNNTDIVDEIILAKLFCKNAGVYGAESFINGFSGHVLDILINHYGSFIALLENSLKWKNGDCIDIENHGNINELNESKVSPLILIDPVYNERNAAAALNLKNIKEFQKKAKEFLKEPKDSYFIPKNITISTLRSMYGKKDGKLIILKAKPLEGKTDVIGCKILKILTNGKRVLKENDFNVIELDWFWNKKTDALLWFFIKKEKLSEDTIRVGPPIKDKENAKKFKNKYPGFEIKAGKLYAKIKRRYKTPEKLVNDFIKSPYVLEKSKKIEML